MVPEKIINHFKYGLLTQVYQVRRNHSIFKKIGNKKSQLEKLKSDESKLFQFVQCSAMTNTVIELTKIYDRPNKKYETRCILEFFNQIEKHYSTLNENKKTNLLELKFKNTKHSKEFLEIIKSNDQNCSQDFVSYYKEKYHSDHLKNLINDILHVRDKYVAHNEMVNENASYESKIVDELCDFAQEIYETFNILFLGEIFIANSTDQNAYFINKAFEKYEIDK